MDTTSRSPVQMLAEVDLFSGLSKRQLRRVVEAGRTVEHQAGHEVATEGLGALAFHLILEGRAVVSSGGRKLRELEVGDYFGEISMIDGRARSATVTAEGPLTTLAVPHQKFEDLVGDEPEFAHKLLATLCARLREAEARN